MNHIGYYGKTVHRGDFVRFNLPKIFVTVWDDWLQKVMSQGEQIHADYWRERYVDSPGYRFVLSGGVAGKDAWAGILIPSIDKVGRCFPLCLSFALPSTTTPALALLDHTDWFDAMDAIADHVNDADYDFTHLKKELVDLSNRASSPSAASIRWVPGDARQNEQIRIIVGSELPLTSVEGVTSALDAVLSESVYQYSIWVARRSGQDADTCITSGLPFGRAGVALFDGNWPAAGCASMRTSNSDLKSATMYPETKNVIDATESATTDEAAAGDRVLANYIENQTAGSTHLSGQEALVPTVEPLELDDDDAELADPWES